MKEKQIICGFSKLDKDQKLDYISGYFENQEDFIKELKSFYHEDEKKQKIFDEFSENTISNFYFPYGIAPNFLIDGNIQHVPLVIEESSVVAAASKSAKFWSNKGGFHTEIISTKKIGQVHFIWHGNFDKLKTLLPDLKDRMIERTSEITANMVARGGGIADIELVDMTHEIPDYYQVKATFETVDSMGANFINSCLEEFAQELKEFFTESPYFKDEERNCEVIMSILSNYTPECLVKVSVECDIDDLDEIDEDLSGDEFAWKFEKAVQIAKVDTYRATTHNKGIFNGIDAVALATGNDFRAIEACGHTYAARDGKYQSLTDVEVKDGKFKYWLTIPLAMGTVGGLTTLHPLAKTSLELLGNPGATELMRIAASVGLANNFGAIKSLVTKGIQKGHMKMHLLNILNQLNATTEEKNKTKIYFEDKKVSYSAVENYLIKLRTPIEASKVVYVNK
ncbi:MAG: hydroxymethylglutaryl-CoA reductase, degradative [Bacteroidales bacterium]|nr:hydroxymethylglutaryl-CoA reductase, degradative [Bacteroidales bacterium]MCF8403015.1 hydroxymethylglutaryl-CoA reductase, degradative [Bacteroidales bacterium]